MTDMNQTLPDSVFRSVGEALTESIFSYIYESPNHWSTDLDSVPQCAGNMAETRIENAGWEASQEILGDHLDSDAPLPDGPPEESDLFEMAMEAARTAIDAELEHCRMQGLLDHYDTHLRLPDAETILTATPLPSPEVILLEEAIRRMGHSTIHTLRALKPEMASLAGDSDRWEDHQCIRFHQLIREFLEPHLAEWSTTVIRFQKSMPGVSRNPESPEYQIVDDAFHRSYLMLKNDLYPQRVPMTQDQIDQAVKEYSRRWHNQDHIAGIQQYVSRYCQKLIKDWEQAHTPATDGSDAPWKDRYPGEFIRLRGKTVTQKIEAAILSQLAPYQGRWEDLGVMEFSTDGMDFWQDGTPATEVMRDARETAQMVLRKAYREFCPTTLGDDLPLKSS